jgi:hypothetical protein
VLCVGQSHGLPQSHAAILGPQQRPTPPHGRVRSRHVSREGGILQSINNESGPPWESAGPRINSPDPQGWSWTPGYTVRTSEVGPGPPLVRAGPLEWDLNPPSHMGSGPPTGGSQGPRTEHTRAVNRTQAAGVDTCPDLAWCGPIRMRYCSLPRRRTNVAMWPTARDVSQWAEPDVRPLGYAAPAFITDKAHHLSIPLISDVPPQHLMRPVHSAGGVPVHSDGRRCSASTFNETCLFRWQAATYPSHRQHACRFH